MQPSAHIQQELARCDELIIHLQTSKSILEVEEHWKRFLYHLERVWYKCESHFGKSPKWNGWKGKFEAIRKGDPLLLYLTNARGAEEHTVEDIVERNPGGLGIAAGPTGSAHIRRLQIGPDGVKFEGEGTLSVTFVPASIRPKPIVNRGRTYAVPNTHRGNLLDPGLLPMAIAGLAYYKALVNAAEAHFVK
jgi:hypothetical protein